MAYLIRWILGALGLVVVASLLAVTAGLGGPWDVFVGLALGRIAGLPSWLEVFQPLAATFGLMGVGLVGGVALGLPVGIWWGRWHPTTGLLAFPVVLVRAAFPLGIGLAILHYAVSVRGWTVPGYLALEPEGGVGVAGRYLLGLCCLVPIAAGEVAWAVARGIRSAGRSGRLGFARSMGIPPSSIFQRWILPHALLSLLGAVPVLLALLASWTAVLEWVFRIGGIGRVIIRSAVGEQPLQALLGLLVVALGISAIHALLRAIVRGGRWDDLGTGRPQLSASKSGGAPLPDPRVTRIWQIRLAIAVGLTLLIPVLPSTFSEHSVIDGWSEQWERGQSLLGPEGSVDAENAEGYGRALLRSATRAGFYALGGAFVTGIVGVLWGLFVGLGGRHVRYLSRWLIHYLRSLPIGLSLLLLAAFQGGQEYLYLALVFLLASRIAGELVARVPSLLPTEEILASRGSGKGALLAHVRALAWPVAERFPDWFHRSLRGWLFAPAFLSFLRPDIGTSGLGKAMAEGFPMIWEIPMLVLAPALLLALLAFAFGLVRLVLPE